jgi:hypothetical protein
VQRKVIQSRLHLDAKGVYTRLDDAKKGPLSRLTQSGRSLVGTFAGGARAEIPTLARVAAQIAQTARPITNIPTSRPLAYPAMAGSSGVVNNYNTNINGAPSPTTGIFAGSVRGLMNQVDREAKLRGWKD